MNCLPKIYPLHRRPATFVAALVPSATRSRSRLGTVGAVYHSERLGSMQRFGVLTGVGSTLTFT